MVDSLRCPRRVAVSSTVISHPARRRPRPLTALLLAVAIVLPLVSAVASTTAQDADGAVLRVHVRFYPSLLDPH
jgi:hypothetical protein